MKGQVKHQVKYHDRRVLLTHCMRSAFFFGLVFSVPWFLSPECRAEATAQEASVPPTAPPPSAENPTPPPTTVPDEIESAPADSGPVGAVGKVGLTDEITAENEPKPTFCPNSKLISLACPEPLGDTAEQHDSNSEENAHPWIEDYRKSSRCKLWWWATYAQAWNYPPLTEWAGYMKDALIENIEIPKTYATLGLAPMPPIARLSENLQPFSTCQSPTGEARARLSEKIGRLNLRNIKPELLLELTQYCLAFEVEASPRKKINTGVFASYIIPIGDLNFVILGKTHFIDPGSPLKNRPESFISASKEFGVTFTAIGTCPVSEDPRNCVEKFIHRSGKNSGFGFANGMRHEFYSLPFRTDLDALYGGGDLDRPVRVELAVGSDGMLDFSLLDRMTGNKSNPNGVSRITLSLDAEGKLLLTTNERLCEPNHREGKRLLLRPIAFGDKARDIFAAMAVYQPSDFPESKRLTTTGIESGCPTDKTYSQWLADTANAAKHYAYHGVGWDSLYRSSAEQRRKWSLKAKGLEQLSDNLTYGKWREDVQESPLPYRSHFEEVATQFSRRRGKNQSKAKVTYKLIWIEDSPATEVWYYAKPLVVPGNEKVQAHVMIKHLGKFQDIYSQAVIQKLTELSTTCGHLEDHKKVFLNAMHALFNAVPLQMGSEAVSRAFMGGAYYFLFGKKLPNAVQFADIDFEALTMTAEDFRKKYLPLI